MSSFDSDPNNFNNSTYNSQNRRGGFDDQPASDMRPGDMGAGGYDQQAHGRGRFDNDNSFGGGNDQSQQAPGRTNQFSASGYNDDSFGPTSEAQRGYGADNQRSYGDTTGTQGYGTGNDFENNRSTGTGSAHGTGNDFSGGQNDDSYGSGNTGTKPSFGDKLKGKCTAEVAAGKMTKNPEMVERGQERKVEGNNY
ncbi:hypothetical protein F5050DRAFT_1806808 [Lentinula boryana]|uniref:Uncharacterized protein n=1 Tax=Lentinula boryana TaxID=40481 RepID=A0ABQ8QG10_9AGAR|nr:hypothetical protein F5050DRAFT_1806808 [Lentinula boryana]